MRRLTLVLLGTLIACSDDAEGGGKDLGRALVECGVTTEGTLPWVWNPYNSWGRCIGSCLAGASCAQLDSLICGPQSDVQDLISDCWRSCGAALGHTCNDGEVLSSLQVCDGLNSCSDGSDETNCGSFDCGDQSTIPSGQVCDLISQCANGSDEANCPGMYFQCDGDTWPITLRCDGQILCADGSDEAGCAALLCGP